MKTCFVISPIGEEGSAIRNTADDLYDLVIKRALEIYDFKVIRGDKLLTTSAITEDVVKYVQNAELCIIDLTGHNPNVFYECGRRHETAKPYIHMKRKGDPIPFDLAGIRTIDYDLTDPRKTNESVDKLREFVNELEKSGYGSQSSSASLDSIATALTRIERKIDGIGSVETIKPVTTERGSTSDSPAFLFYDSLKSADYNTAVSALQRFMLINTDVNLHLDMASMLVEAFVPNGVPIVKSILEKDFNYLEPSKLAIALHGLYTYYAGALAIENEYKYLNDLTNKALQKQNISNKDKAALINVLASLEYSMKNDIQALEYQKKTVELCPTEPAYYYNIATLYQLLDMQEDLVRSVNLLLNIYKNKDPKKDKVNLEYINFARKYFVEKNQTSKVQEIDEIIANAKQYPQNIAT